MMRSDLTDLYTKAVCKIGQGHACCRYLTMGSKGWDCEKHSPLKSVLDSRANAGMMTARSDNCEGVGSSP